MHRPIAVSLLALALAATATIAEDRPAATHEVRAESASQAGDASSAPAAADKGTVRIFTVPGEAELYANGARIGTSPGVPDETFSIRLPAGEHRIEAAKAGFGSVQHTVFVAPETEQTIQIALTPEIVMVPLPGGCFMMGSPEGEPERDADEGPQHQVCVKPFEIGKYEVTFDDWDACVADRGCLHRPDDEGWGRGRRPVIDVSWDDAQAYVAWLNTPVDKGYRLPSEAEWEYAARAGTTTPFSTGDCIHTDQANYDGTFEYADCRTESDVDLGQTVPVGSYPPNPWGLHDMHGNVNEWTQDCWNAGYEGAPTDGSAWLDGNCTRRVMRSGSWYGYAGYMRSSYRCRAGPTFRHRSIGLRLVRPLSE